MAIDYSEALQQIEDCENRESKLTEWEVTFLSSLSDRLGDGLGLTDRQLAKLDSIWNRVTD